MALDKRRRSHGDTAPRRSPTRAEAEAVDREKAATTARSHRPALRSTLTDGFLLLFGLLVSLCLGAAHSLPMSYPIAWWVQIACVAGLAWQVGRATPLHAALIGLLFGTAWGVAGTWWLYISMHSYGGLSGVMSGLGVLALNLFLSLYLAIALALFSRLRRNRALLDALLFAACWTLAELARGKLLTGFPWVASGYAHVDGPLGNLAPWIGVYGIGFVSAALGAALVLGARQEGQRNIGVALGIGVSMTVVVLLALIKPPPFTQPTSTLTVSLLQSNVPQDQKFADAAMPQTLAWAQSQLLAARGQLVVGPETIIPLTPEELPADYWKTLQSRFQNGEQAALIGRPLGSLQGGFTNSVVGLSREWLRQPEGFYRYDKQHLVPFGEFIPSGFRWFTNMMRIPLGDFTRGVLVPPSFAFRGERIAPNICYEDLFGEELALRFGDMDVAPTILANVSNIGWFGDTIATKQHLNISRMRTLELQRPMIRATNTGATVVIDHQGVVKSSLPPFTQAVLESQVEGRKGLTPYTIWVARYGLWPLVAISVFVMLLTLPLRRRV